MYESLYIFFNSTSTSTSTFGLGWTIVVMGYGPKRRVWV